jgi:hypothetical protein
MIYGFLLSKKKKKKKKKKKRGNVGKDQLASLGI